MNIVDFPLVRPDPEEVENKGEGAGQGNEEAGVKEAQRKVRLREGAQFINHHKPRGPTEKGGDQNADEVGVVNHK